MVPRRWIRPIRSRVRAQGVRCRTRMGTRLLETAGTLLLVVGAAVDAKPATQVSAPIKVIVGKDNALSELQRAELSRIYLGRKTLWKSGQRIAPAMLDDSSRPAEAFLKGTVAKTSSQFRAYWKRQLFSGGGAPPRTFGSSAQVAEFVAGHPGAIGIVEDTFAGDQVKALQVTD